MTRTLLTSAIVIGAALGIGGCAAHGSATQAQVDQAMRKAESAQATANEAQRTANRALQTSQANSKRIDRMFKSSQRK